MGKKTLRFENAPVIFSSASVVGKKEKEGPLSRCPPADPLGLTRPPCLRPVRQLCLSLTCLRPVRQLCQPPVRQLHQKEGRHKPGRMVQDELVSGAEGLYKQRPEGNRLPEGKTAAAQEGGK